MQCDECEKSNSLPRHTPSFATLQHYALRFTLSALVFNAAEGGIKNQYCTQTHTLPGDNRATRHFAARRT